MTLWAQAGSHKPPKASNQTSPILCTPGYITRFPEFHLDLKPFFSFQSSSVFIASVVAWTGAQFLEFWAVDFSWKIACCTFVEADISEAEKYFARTRFGSMTWLAKNIHTQTRIADQFAPQNPQHARLGFWSSSNTSNGHPYRREIVFILLSYNLLTVSTTGAAWRDSLCMKHSSLLHYFRTSDIPCLWCETTGIGDKGFRRHLVNFLTKLLLDVLRSPFLQRITTWCCINVWKCNHFFPPETATTSRLACYFVVVVEYVFLS